MNDKFHKASEIKKNLAKNKISQMKETALKEIKNNLSFIFLKASSKESKPLEISNKEIAFKI